MTWTCLAIWYTVTRNWLNSSDFPYYSWGFGVTSFPPWNSFIVLFTLLTLCWGQKDYILDIGIVIPLENVLSKDFFWKKSFIARLIETNEAMQQRQTSIVNNKSVRKALMLRMHIQILIWVSLFKVRYQGFFLFVCKCFFVF